MSCVSPQALLSSLVSRAEREAEPPTREDIATLLALGCTREELTRRFERAPAAVRARLAELIAG